MNSTVSVSRQALRIILRTLLRRGGGILLRDRDEAEAADALFKAAYATTVEPVGATTVEPAEEPAFEPAKVTTVKPVKASKAKRRDTRRDK